MLDRLPVLINPVSFSERGKTLSGIIEISELARLSDVLVDKSGKVEINFSFSKEGRVPTIQGEIKTNLILKCQSCLESLDWPVNASIKLGIVQSLEQADRLASDCEPLMLETEKISLNDLVEDELLLALPDFPRHKKKCVDESNGIEDVFETTQKNDEAELESNNPFSVLAKLKNTGD